jgi:hypothetical protein
MNKSYGNFNKDQFEFDGGYLTYDLNPQDFAERNVFIARFKYNRSLKGRFVTFLKNNFTVSEYLGYLETGMTPLAVLQSKGFQFMK